MALRPQEAPKSSANQASSSEPSLLASEQVTYLPGPGDPVQVKWGKHVFSANVPRPVTDPRLIEKAKSNKFFKVGQFDPQRDGVKTEAVVLPKTAEQYRAWCIAWAKTMERVTDFDRRWQEEEGLRIACEVGTEDLDLINSVIGPMRAELVKRDRPT
jgi:hypothetical protein